MSVLHSCNCSSNFCFGQNPSYTREQFTKTMPLSLCRRLSHHIQLAYLFHNDLIFQPPSPPPTDLSKITTKSQLLQSYTVSPPIKPWPQKLSPKRLLSIITSQQNLDLALQIFHHAGNYHPNFHHTYETYDSIITKLARAFQPLESLLFQLRSSNIKCGENLFITVIRNYEIASRPDDAVHTFLKIKVFGVQRSVRSFNTLLNALIQNRNFKLVHLLFKSCSSKFKVTPNVFTCNILLEACCKNNDLEGALKVLDEIPTMGMVPNVVTYTTILSGYVSRGDLVGARFDELLDKEKKSGEAVSMMDDMLEKKYVPSSGLCCRLIDALCDSGKVEEACDLWKKLLRKNVTPDNAISSTLIYWLCKKGKIWEARKLFDDFEKSAIPSVMTYNTLIGGMCEVGELCGAGRLWDDMVEKGLTPNAFTYNMLLKGFCNIGNAREGMRVFEEMVEKGCSPDKCTYSILLVGLCNSREDEAEVFKVLSMAASSGQGIDEESWKVFMTKVGANHNKGKFIREQLKGAFLAL